MLAPAELQDCVVCGGTGWISAADADDRSVQRCECRLQARQQRQVERARIPRRYELCRLSNFETEYAGAHSTLGGARLKCERYVDEYPRLEYGLLFIGQPGVGKTHLAVGVLSALLDRYSISGRFVDYRDLLRDIQESYNPVSETSELQVLRPLLEADVLLLDDLGARRPSPWVFDTVTHILNDRYNRKRITLITTNFGDAPGAASEAGSSSPGAVDSSRMRSQQPLRARRSAPDGPATLKDRIGPALRSRLHEMCDVIRIKGKDARKLLKSASVPYR